MILLFLVLAVCCLATCLLEMIPALFMKQRAGWLKTGLLCNVITNPILNTWLLLLGFYINEDSRLFLAMVFSELAVVAVEAWMYRKLLQAPWKRCLGFAFVANLFSLVVGLLFTAFVMSIGFHTPMRPTAFPI